MHELTDARRRLSL